ncbi:MAG TPA: SDR family oxidoreductase [Kofleriaceae bacterium]|nr:SDR family oxidoreductase [Kofleriaceae bacterium]
MSFAERTAVVTGGASGIGRALCRALHQRGANVWVTDVDGDGAERVAKELGERAHARVLDVIDAPAVKALVDEVAAVGSLDYLFNNAGYAVIGEIKETTLEDFDRIFAVNVRGVMNGIAAAYPIMIDRGRGHLVNTASVAGLIPAPGMGVYSATKHAVVGLSRTLRIEAARYGVRVSAVCPGFIKTRITENATARGVDAVDASKSVPFWYSAEDCARDILHGVRRNDGVIVVARHAKSLHRLDRLVPGAVDWIGRRFIGRILRAQ